MHLQKQRDTKAASAGGGEDVLSGNNAAKLAAAKANELLAAPVQAQAVKPAPKILTCKCGAKGTSVCQPID